MLRIKGRQPSSSKHAAAREGEFSEPDTRMVFAVLAVGVLIGALLMPGKSPSGAKAKAPPVASAAAEK